MKPYIIIALIIIVVALFVFYYIYYKKKQVSDALVDLILKRDFKQFDEIIDSYQASSAMSSFNRYMLKLKKGIMLGHKNEIKEAYDNALLFADKDSKKEELYTTMLEYFIKIDAKHRVEEMYEELNKLPRLKNKANIESLYNQFVK